MKKCTKCVKNLIQFSLYNNIYNGRASALSSLSKKYSDSFESVQEYLK